jgi:predicted nucleic acid-binding protein
VDATFNWKPEQTLLEKLITLAHQRGQSPESIVNEAVKLYLEIESPKSNVTSDSDPLVGLFATANDDQDVMRVAEILEDYGDTRIDFVDATVMAVAERYGITKILTLDQRDFRLFRPKDCDSFEILP